MALNRYSGGNLSGLAIDTEFQVMNPSSAGVYVALVDLTAYPGCTFRFWWETFLSGGYPEVWVQTVDVDPATNVTGIMTPPIVVWSAALLKGLWVSGTSGSTNANWEAYRL